jgi:hypothetical protein
MTKDTKGTLGTVENFLRLTLTDGEKTFTTTINIQDTDALVNLAGADSDMGQFVLAAVERFHQPMQAVMRNIDRAGRTCQRVRKR